MAHPISIKFHKSINPDVLLRIFQMFAFYMLPPSRGPLVVFLRSRPKGFCLNVHRTKYKIMLLNNMIKAILRLPKLFFRNLSESENDKFWRKRKKDFLTVLYHKIA